MTSSPEDAARRVFEDVVRDCERVLASDPKDAGFLVLRGITLSGLGHLAEAVASFEKALSLDPGHELGWCFYGEVLADRRGQILT